MWQITQTVYAPDGSIEGTPNGYPTQCATKAEVMAIKHRRQSHFNIIEARCGRKGYRITFDIRKV